MCEDCTSAPGVRIRVIQEYKVKYLTESIVLILLYLLLSEKLRHLLDGLAVNAFLDKS